MNTDAVDRPPEGEELMPLDGRSKRIMEGAKKLALLQRGAGFIDGVQYVLEEIDRLEQSQTTREPLVTPKWLNEVFNAAHVREMADISVGTADLEFGDFG